MHIVFSTQHRLHDPGPVMYAGEPLLSEEIPARAELILNALQAAKLGAITAPTDHGEAPIRAVHPAGYIHFLQTIFVAYTEYYKQKVPVFPETFASRRPRRRPSNLLWLPGYYAFGVGSPILKGTWEAAYWSAQCALTAAHIVSKGEPCAYALCRPPGHHAARDQYGGFCYLNNAAIAARSLEARVAILDIDYHHGNGTQEIFYNDPSVLFCSLHADPELDYPYFWGAAGERGAGRGKGCNLNWPLPPGTGDNAYLSALHAALAAIRDFMPRYLIVSFGVDILSGDPVGGFEVTLAGLHEIGRQIAGLGLPTIIVQEGGYLLEKIGEGVVGFLSAFP